MGEVIKFTRDTLANLTSALGTERDKSAMSFYVAQYLDDQYLANAYRGSWLPRKIVDVPANDSVRAWRDWQAKQEQILKIEAEERRLDLQAKVLEARIKARLFGGSGIYIGTADSDLSQPLDPASIARGGIRYLVVLPRRQLTSFHISYDPLSPYFNKTDMWQVSSENAGQVLIHPSRLAIFQGAPLPDELLMQSQWHGWSDSVLASTMEAIRNTDATAANVASLIFEAKVDVVSIPDLMNNLSDPNYKSALLERFKLAMTQKGINQTLILDKEEEYEQKSLTFANLDKITMMFLQMVAGAADIPLTRLLGQSPGGMNATGQHDTENYNKMIGAEQRIHMTPAMRNLDECLIRSALGSRPSAVTYQWAPLDEISEKDLAEMGQIQASSVVALAATDVLPLEVLSKAFINQASESGTMPGLDAMMQEYLKTNPNYYGDLEKQKADAAKAALAAPSAKGAAKKATVPTPARTAPAASSFNK